MKTPRRIVAYRIGQIGDTVIALPAFWALRRQFPDAHLTLLSDAQSDSAAMLARSVLPEQGLFDAWMNYPSGGSGSSVRAMLALLPRLRRERFDTLAYLAPRLRTRKQVQRDLLFFRAAGIRRFVGHEGFSPLPELAGRPDGTPLPTLEHEADHLLSRLSRSGVAVPPAGRGSLEMALTPAERQAADDWLQTLRTEGRPLIGLCPGSKWASKIWPEANYVELGRRLASESGAFPLIFGGPGDEALAQRLLKAWGCGASAAGVLNVRQAAAALRHCAAYVGNDTGTMHLAAAVGMPCVAVFSAQDWPGRWYPYGAGHVVLRRSVPCEGCLQPECPEGHLRCLNEIEVDEVFRAVAGKLAPLVQLA